MIVNLILRESKKKPEKWLSQWSTLLASMSIWECNLHKSPKIKLGIVAHTFQSWKIETGRHMRLSGQLASLTWQVQDLLEMLSQKPRWTIRDEQHSRLSSLFSAYVYRHTHACMHTCVYKHTGCCGKDLKLAGR